MSLKGLVCVLGSFTSSPHPSSGGASGKPVGIWAQVPGVAEMQGQLGLTYTYT